MHRYQYFNSVKDHHEHHLKIRAQVICCSKLLKGAKV